MATLNISYQTIATAITCTMTSKTDGTWFSSALVDNQTNKYIDAVFGGSIQTGTLSANGWIEVYLAASWDGVQFSGGADAGDGSITWGTTGNTSVLGYMQLTRLRPIFTDATDDDTDTVFGPYSVVDALGQMPLEWAVIFRNKTGATTNATGTNNVLEYTGIELDSA